MIETHYKTRIVFVSFAITTSGWWAWNAFLASAYSVNLSPYDVKHGFDHGFGRDPIWWLALVLTLCILLAFELMWKAVRRDIPDIGKLSPVSNRSRVNGPEELNVEMWQEMQKNPRSRRNLDGLIDDGPTQVGGEPRAEGVG